MRLARTLVTVNDANAHLADKVGLRLVCERLDVALDAGRPDRVPIARLECPEDREGIPVRPGQSQTVKHTLIAADQIGPHICPRGGELADDAGKTRIESWRSNARAPPG